MAGAVQLPATVAVAELEAASDGGGHGQGTGPPGSGASSKGDPYKSNSSMSSVPAHPIASSRHGSAVRNGRLYSKP